MKKQSGMIRLPIEVWKRLKELAKKDKRTMGNTISVLIDFYNRHKR